MTSETYRTYRTNRTDSADGTAIYLYCLTLRDSSETIEGLGVDDLHPITHLVVGELAAVVSAVDLANWQGPTTEARLKDLRWVGPRVWRHEKLIEQVAIRGPALPARFATLFSSPQALLSLLEINYETILQFLNYVADKEEWAVKGLLDRATAQEAMFNSDARVANLPPPSGLRHLLEQQIRAAIARELERWVGSVSEHIGKNLQGNAVESRSLKTLPREVSGRDLDMIFNWAFLIERARRESFENEVAKASSDYSGHGLVLELSGPWPPYNFCSALRSPEPCHAGTEQHDP